MGAEVSWTFDSFKLYAKGSNLSDLQEVHANGQFVIIDLCIFWHAAFQTDHQTLFIYTLISKLDITLKPLLWQYLLCDIELCNIQYPSWHNAQQLLLWITYKINIVQTCRLLTGFKETGFIHAITSSALVHTVARACSRGAIDGCTCAVSSNEATNRDSWRWGGCGDNIEYAAKFTRKFLRSKDIARDLKGRVDHHNSKAGIKASYIFKIIHIIMIIQM